MEINESIFEIENLEARITEKELVDFFHESKYSCKLGNVEIVKCEFLNEKDGISNF